MTGLVELFLGHKRRRPQLKKIVYGKIRIRFLRFFFSNKASVTQTELRDAVLVGGCSPRPR